jgi:hypothetical protein
MMNNQGYMMYPMMEQGYQWPQQYYNNRSVDSARSSKSKSNSTEKDASKKGSKKEVNFAQPQMMNQFVPVYMMPPGFQGHPGAFNAALAAHAASQGNVPNMYQMPAYNNMGAYLPYGYPAAQKAGYYAQNYSGSDYQTNSLTEGSSQGSLRASKSSDSSKNSRGSRSTTSKDSARHSVENDNMRKNSVKRLPVTKTQNTKKVQSTFCINISKNQAKKVQNAPSCGRSHSTGSDLSAGCSASACVPAPAVARSCSHESQDSHKLEMNNNSIKCCSTDCDHVGPMFENMRKFSNNTDFKKPDAELTKKLIELIEFYLSDEYLAKDKYLLRQIRCKSEGYISIKLMTSFKKVKKLTRDWRTVRFALLQTDNLIVSPEGFRVKRATQLPENLRKPRLLSSVVTIRLTEEMATVEAMTNTFAKYGEIALVRILKPGKEIPSDLRNYATQVPDIGKSTCAVVDFEQSESALQAVRCLKDTLCEQKMRLALLGPRVRRTLYKQDKDGDDEDLEVEEVEKAMEQAPEPIEAPKTQNLSSFKNITIQAKVKSVRVDSHDSGNQDESTGNQSNDEDLKAVVFPEDNTVKATARVTLSPLVNKITTIVREPAGPGTSQNNGFAIRRSMYAN